MWIELLKHYLQAVRQNILGLIWWHCIIRKVQLNSCPSENFPVKEIFMREVSLAFSMNEIIIFGFWKKSGFSIVKSSWCNPKPWRLLWKFWARRKLLDCLFSICSCSSSFIVVYALNVWIWYQSKSPRNFAQPYFESQVLSSCLHFFIFV